MADDMLHDARRVFRLRTDSMRTEIGLEIMLRQGAEPDAAGSDVVVDTDQDSEPVHLAPCVLIPWKPLHKSHGCGVFDPPSLRTHTSVSEHPGLSFLAAYFLE